ncbi:MAG: hypothetical protein HYS83_02785 [Candidatus Blackburnbacteria bacterium]|nr:hypothetical protein [Candidatus Blackburnbacteria bacterium]
MKKLLYFVTFFTITPVTILASLVTLNIVSTVKETPPAQSHEPTASAGNIALPRYGARVYAALPDSVGEVAGAATTADARLEIVKQYLENYKSPLAPHAQDILDTSEKYGLDFRLLVAIAQQESNLCKKIPENSYNCWGWGVHSRGTLRFTNYKEAMEAVAKGIREEYIDKGYTTPEEIMAKYTPLSPGTWALGVRQFLEEME